VKIRRELEASGEVEISYRPTSLNLSAVGGNQDLLSSPVLLSERTFQNARIRTYSGSESGVNKRKLKKPAVISDDETSETDDEINA